jgi:RNA polymerase sigma-70 factor (ECF subfamily)
MPTQAPTVSEGQLVAALRAGEAQAFEAIVLRYNSSLQRLARSYVPSQAVAEEVVQETWLGVLDGIDRFRSDSSLKTWIFRILVNRAMTRGARERRTLPFSSLETTGEDAPAFSPDQFLPDGHWAVAPRAFEVPEDRLSRLEFRGALRRALEGLPERQRVVVTLRDVEGLSSEEVCDMLNLSTANQRVLLHRGRSRLQQALREYQDGL